MTDRELAQAAVELANTNNVSVGDATSVLLQIRDHSSPGGQDATQIVRRLEAAHGTLYRVSRDLAERYYVDTALTHAIQNLRFGIEEIGIAIKALKSHGIGEFARPNAGGLG